MKFLNEDELAEKRNAADLLSVDGLAKKLNVPISWVYGKSREGTIPKIKVGKYVRFQLDEVMDWLKKE